MENNGFFSALDKHVSTHNCGSRLDEIYTNFKVFRSGTYDSYFSDHKLVFVEF